jgi:hypothetical protein
MMDSQQMWNWQHSLPSLTFIGVQSECGCHVGPKSVNNPSSRYSDIQNKGELQVAANVCPTAVTVPCCITVIKLALRNNSTVTIHRSTEQNFMWLNSKQHFKGIITLTRDAPTVTYSNLEPSGSNPIRGKR